MKLEKLVSKIDDIHNSIQSQTIKNISKNLTLRNWIIGYFIVEYEQDSEDKAKYGNKIIQNLAQKLKYLKGMSLSNLKS